MSLATPFIIRAKPWVITLLKLCGFWTKVSTLLDFVTCSMANLVYNIIFSELKAALEVRFFIVIPDLNVLILFEWEIQLQTSYIIHVLFSGTRFKMNSKIVYASLSILITTLILLASFSIAEGKFYFVANVKTFLGTLL